MVSFLIRKNLLKKMWEAKRKGFYLFLPQKKFKKT